MLWFQSTVVRACSSFRQRRPVVECRVIGLLGLAARIYERTCVSSSEGRYEMGPVSVLGAVVVETDIGSFDCFY